MPPAEVDTSECDVIIGTMTGLAYDKPYEVEVGATVCWIWNTNRWLNVAQSQWKETQHVHEWCIQR